jgi:hypothetical protein
MFSINGTVNRPAGTAAINKTLIIYLDMYVTVGKLGHSGKISSGVANGFAASPSAAGSKTKTNYMQKRPKL